MWVYLMNLVAVILVESGVHLVATLLCEIIKLAAAVLALAVPAGDGAEIRNLS